MTERRNSASKKVISFFLFDYTHWREKLSRKIILHISFIFNIMFSTADLPVQCTVYITVGYTIYKGFPNKFAKTKFLEPILEVQCKLISNGGLLVLVSVHYVQQCPQIDPFSTVHPSLHKPSFPSCSSPPPLLLPPRIMVLRIRIRSDLHHFYQIRFRPQLHFLTGMVY